MSQQHECMFDACAKTVGIEWALCREHWKMLPFDLSSAIARSYVRSVGLGLEFASPALTRALRTAQSWMRTELAGVDDTFDPGAWDRLKRIVREKDAARAERLRRDRSDLT